MSAFWQPDIISSFNLAFRYGKLTPSCFLFSLLRGESGLRSPCEKPILRAGMIDSTIDMVYSNFFFVNSFKEQVDKHSAAEAAENSEARKSVESVQSAASGEDKAGRHGGMPLQTTSKLRKTPCLLAK